MMQMHILLMDLWPTPHLAAQHVQSTVLATWFNQKFVTITDTGKGILGKEDGLKKMTANIHLLSDYFLPV